MSCKHCTPSGLFADYPKDPREVTLAIVGPRTLGAPEKRPGQLFPVYRNTKQVDFAFSKIGSLVQQLQKREQKTHADWCIFKHLTIVSGGALGADDIGRLWAKLNQVDYHEYPAKWELYHLAAGHMRNPMIIQPANYVLAFWDGKSKGTKGSIDIAMKHKKKLKVVRYD